MNVRMELTRSWQKFGSQESRGYDVLRAFQGGAPPLHLVHLVAGWIANMKKGVAKEKLSIRPHQIQTEVILVPCSLKG